ncbi:MAG TPA: DUF222 domain-containing protein, partial [Vicinamibacterales bacterium]
MTPPAALASRRLSPIDQLGEDIAELAARIHAATYELLVMLRQFDSEAGWNNGFLSCAHWLNWRTGIDLGAAREKVRVARALAALPLISAAMQCGSVSYAKVRAITRVATPETEQRLLDVALTGTAAHVERIVRAWRHVDRVVAAENADEQHLSRHLRTWVDDDGMLVLRGRLPPEVGAVVHRALEAAADQLYREAKAAPNAGGLSDEVDWGQRRADALGRLAEVALAADLDAGTAGDRYQVVLHVDAGAGQTVGDEFDGALEVTDGALRVSAETSRRLACDASVVRMQHDHGGTVLDVGRKTRTIPPAIRRALHARDNRCQFPGCNALRCDAHHIEHWVDGGETNLDNLLLLCRRHHRSVHEGTIRLKRQPDGTVAFFHGNGLPVPSAPPLPCWAS